MFFFLQFLYDLNINHSHEVYHEVAEEEGDGQERIQARVARLAPTYNAYNIEQKCIYREGGGGGGGGGGGRDP